MAELQSLKTTLSETNINLLLNPDFTEAFQNRPSILLSQLGPNASPTTDTKLMLEACKNKLENLSQELKGRAKGHRVGWERIKGALLAKHTRESVENLHRQCQALNRMVSIDTAVLGATTYNEIKKTRKEQQDAGAEQREARKEQQKWHESEGSQRILTWLTSTDYGLQQSDYLSRRQAGTGEWLLDSDEFQGWCNGQGQTLFCPGMPGAGKTIMTSIVVDYLSTTYQDENNIGIAYLYCNFRRKDEQKPVDLLASLLKQLLLGLPNIPDSVRSLYEHHKNKQTRPSFDEISKELHAVANSYLKCFIIADALDECQVTDGGRRKLLSELFNLQTRATASLFATSRFIPEIAKEFAGKCASLEIHASNEDVRRYLDGHITRLPSFVLRNVDLQEEIRTEIVKAVQGMFLLAQLHLDSLAGSKSIKTLKKALRDLPKGSNAYDHAYKEAMDRIQGQIANSRELAKQALSWITCAKRPLTTLELQHALAVEIGETELDETNRPDIEDMVSVCAGLVTIDQESNIIRLVHYTTQEFFERTWKEWFPHAETDVAKTCITYLSFDTFKTGFCRTDERFKERLRRNPLYDYAARNWGHHARATSAGVKQLILDFLDSNANVSGCSEVMMASGSSPSYRQYLMTGGHLAAYFGLKEVMISFLESRYDSNSKDGTDRTPLSWAASNGNEAVVKVLLAKNDIAPGLKDTMGRTPLSWAAENGHIAVVKVLLAKDGVDPNSKDKFNQTSLLCAAKNGHEAVVKMLLAKHGIDPDSKDDTGQTPLLGAVENGNEAVIKTLLAKDGIDPNSKNKLNQTSLLCAAKNGHGAVVKMLLAKHGIDPDSKDDTGQTPLSWAARNGKEAVVKVLLVKDGVDPNSEDTIYCQTPLRWAAEKGHEAVVKLLLDHDRVDLDSKDAYYGRTPLLWAARHRHEAVIKLLLAKDGVDPNDKDNNGRTLLFWVAGNGQEAMVELLLAKKGVDPNSDDENGRTPLSWAAGNGHEAVVKLLLGVDGVNPDSKDNNGRTPLSWAAEEGDEAVIKLLLAKNGVDPNSMDKYGWEPRWLAAANGHEAVAKLLLAKDGGEAVVVKLLLAKHGIDLDPTKIHYGRTPLSWAAENGHEAVLRLLLAENDLDPDLKDDNGRTPLSWAAGNGHEAVIELLLAENDLDPDLKDDNGRTPLSWAASNGHEAVVKVLLAKNNVVPDLKDNMGRAPLSWAAENGHAAAVKLLLAKGGVDPDFKDKFGWKPRWWAVANGHEAVKGLIPRSNVTLQ